MFGEQARWGDLEHLMATAVDVLQVANIQRTGKKHRFHPVERPGAKDRKRYGNRSYTVEQLRRRRERRARERGE
jgi:hypothetical protein